MIDTPQITQTDAQLTAIIHLTIPRSEIQSVMEQGIGPAGPWFTHHLKMDPAQFDFEICVPVTAPVKAVGRVKSGSWPAMKVARTTLRGGYEQLGDAWGQFQGWLKANGHKAAPDIYERYVAGPESSSNPADWRTELNSPLA
jgi:effector-binding domain-containing protein